MIHQITHGVCTLLNGCGDLAHRLPTLPDIFLCAVPGGFLVWVLSTLYGWVPAVFNAVLVGLTDLFMYVRLDAAHWPQGDAAMAAFFSLTGLIFMLPVEGRVTSDYPRSRWCVRLITPLIYVGFPLLLWMQAAVPG